MRWPVVDLGVVVATPGALATVDAATITELLARHQGGDWGDVCASDARENDLSVKRGYRIISSYTVADGRKVWIITEADRSSTCILLPEEY